jgi:hypothetical protein
MECTTKAKKANKKVEKAFRRNPKLFVDDRKAYSTNQGSEQKPNS